MLSSAKIIAFAPSKDLSRSRHFYQSILGLRFVSKDPFAVVFDAAGTLVRISAVPDFHPAPFTILGWSVPKIDVTIRKLQARDISCERYAFLQQDDLGIWTSPNSARIAWFKDPDGNILSLTEFPRKQSRRKKRSTSGTRRTRG